MEDSTNSVVGDGDACRVRSAGAVHSPAGMRARRREVEAANRRLGPAQTGDGPEHELLVELRGAGTDRAAREVRIARFEIGGTHHVTPAHARTESGR